MVDPSGEESPAGEDATNKPARNSECAESHAVLCAVGVTPAW